tara:strand:+ start:6239 stop:7345 length:1107 start_codon:yes stop_codon:yes gene_type:complete
MENTNENNKTFSQIINLSVAVPLPDAKINKGKGYIEWGTKNVYPDYILSMFNSKGSALFTAIINKKTKLMSAAGFKMTTDPILNAFIKKNRLNHEIKKIVLDYELFNAFALEIIYDKIGENINKILHVPLSNIRLGLNDDMEIDHYKYSADWSQSRKDMYAPIDMVKYDGSKKGKQTYVYFEYNPQNKGAYAVLPYDNIINFINIDHKIGVFHLNQISNGYNPSMIVNIPDTPNPEERKEFSKNFKKNFAGEERSGKVIITYADETAPTITPFVGNDSDKRFVTLAKQTENTIIQGMEIPLQLVSLIPGKMGATEDREALLAEFNTSYILPRQDVINEVLNELFDGQFTEQIELGSIIKEEAKTEETE